MENRQAELLPVPYFHVVFTLPAAIADIAYYNKAVIYAILFKASSEAMLTIAADPKHLGAKIGVISVLHTWGSAMTHHMHVHMIVPGGGLSPDGKSWIASRSNLLACARSDKHRATSSSPCACCRAGCGACLTAHHTKMIAAHKEKRLEFFGAYTALADEKAFAAFLAPSRRQDWAVYSKRPFAGPEQVLAYLSRYTHRVAIANSRLLAANDKGVTFKYKDYRVEGPGRHKTMTLSPHEFIRRFLIHVLLVQPGASSPPFAANLRSELAPDKLH